MRKDQARDRDQPGVVVAGAGAAGHSAARTLRQEGYTGPLTVLHPEPHAPYNRTLVNKAVLQGLLTAEQIALPSLDDAGRAPHSCRRRRDRPRCLGARLDNGERLPYSTLIAATGSTPRSHNPTSARLLGCCTSTRSTTRRGSATGSATTQVRGPSRCSVPGSSARRPPATWRMPVPRCTWSPGPRSRSPAYSESSIARRVSELHAAHVTTHFGRQVRAVSGHRDSVTVTLDDGQVLESDLAVVAHGTVPASAWATDTEEGIAVDDRLRAVGLRRVYAAGSVAVHTGRMGQSYRVDHWDAATGQGAHAARTLLHDHADGEDPGPYAPSTGFTLSLYRHAIAAYGVALPGAVERQHPTGRRRRHPHHFPRAGTPGHDRRRRIRRVTGAAGAPRPAGTAMMLLTGREERWQ